MILLIDNYDSFTYNLAHLFGELGAEVTVRRNDTLDPACERAQVLITRHIDGEAGPEDAQALREWNALGVSV